MHLNGKVKFQLTIEDRVEDEVEGVLTLMSANQLCMIEVLGNTTKNEVKLDNPLSLIRSMLHLVRVALYRFRVAQRTSRSSGSDQ